MAMKEGPGASAARLQSEVEEDDYEKGNDYLQKMTPVASSDDVEHQEQLKGNCPVIVYTYLVEWTLSRHYRNVVFKVAWTSWVHQSRIGGYYVLY